MPISHVYDAIEQADNDDIETKFCWPTPQVETMLIQAVNNSTDLEIAFACIKFINDYSRKPEMRLTHIPTQKRLELVLRMFSENGELLLPRRTYIFKA